MKKEFNFKKASRVGSRFKNADVKVSVTTRIDPEVVAWLKKESERKAIPYQTLINSILTQAMNTNSEEERIRKVVKEEIKKKAVGD